MNHKQHIKDLLLFYQDGEYLTDGDFDFMLEILKKHDNAEEKIGCGVSGIFINTNQPYTTRGFRVKRLDGTTIDFSYHKCLKHKPKTKMALFKSACREAVSLDMLLAKKGLSLVAHHSDITFNKIVDDFILENNIDIDTIDIKDHGIGVVFGDINFREFFREYHKSKAVIVLVTQEQHLKEHGCHES